MSKTGEKLYRKIRQLSEEIAVLSAHTYSDNENSWRGTDMPIGNLPFKIQKKLARFIDWYEREKNHENNTET
jgi:hypothetical protein